MADMTPLTDILNGDDADATPVQSNFQTIETYINGTDLVRTDGTEVMAADLDMGGFGLTNSTLPGLIFHGTGTHAADGSSPDDINIDTEVVDTASVGAVGSNVLTFPAAGVYSIVSSSSNTGGGGNTLTFTASTGSDTFQVSGSASTSYVSNTAFYPAGATLTVTFGYTGTPTLTFDFKIYRLA
jgi:hypothetical protein